MPLHRGSASFSSSTARRSTARLAFLGHSFGAFAIDSTANGAGTNITLSADGPGFWLQAMLGPRLEYPFMTTGRYGGQPLSTFLTNMPAFLVECASKAITDVWHEGIVNDAIGTKAQVDAAIAKITALAAGVTGAGINFHVSSDMPAGGAQARTTGNGRLPGFHRYQAYCLYDLPRMFTGGGSRGRVIAHNWYQDLIAPATTDGTPIAKYMEADLYHPSVWGNFVKAKRMYNWFNTMYPAFDDQSESSNSNLYDATASAPNKRGNILTNPILDGTGGTLNTGVTGSVATSWIVPATPSGIATAASKVTSGNLIKQRFAITGTSVTAASIALMRQDPSVSRFNQGDKVRASCYILPKKTDAATGMVNVRGFLLQHALSDTTPTAGYNGDCGGQGVATVDIWPTDEDFSAYNGGLGLFLRTPETEITGAWTSGQFARWTLNLYLDAAAATDVAVDVARARLYKTYAVTDF